MTDPLALSPLEVATGSVFGVVTEPPLRPASGNDGARVALERVIAQALRRPPCVVSFSGGRDSSAVLAVATHVARREGLPLPVPVSLHFPECESADEGAWQELVVRELGLPDWQRLTFRDELDLVGPVASQVLRDKGVLWPFNAFFHVPMFDVGTGGSLLSGAGGDEVFSDGWNWHRENLVASGRRRPLPMDVVRLAVSLGPPQLRRRFLRLRRDARPMSRPDWLRPAAFDAIRERQLSVAALESLSFRRSVSRTLWRMRSRQVGERSLSLLSRDRDVEYQAPLASADFLSALIRERGWRMFRDRTSAMRWLVGDLLPEALLTRPTKAWFDTAFFNVHARAFARSWDGSGVDPDYVDPDELRQMWLTDTEPDARTYQLLQQAWLAAATSGHE